MTTTEPTGPTPATTLEEQLAAATERADELELENARLQAIIRHGIPAEHAHLLDGTDPEQIDAQAAKLAALLERQARGKTNPTSSGPTSSSQLDTHLRAKATASPHLKNLNNR